MAADEVFVAVLEGHLHGKILLLELGHREDSGWGMTLMEHRLCQPSAMVR
jgi:hypothetical protein